MINIDLIYNLTRQIANDNQITGRFSVDDWNRYVLMATRERVDQLRKEFESNTKNSDNTADLKVKKQISIDSVGRMTKPDDYLYFSAPLTTVFYKDSEGNQKSSKRSVDLVTDNQLGDRLNSQFDQPTFDYPIVLDYQNFLQFYPENLTSANLMYIRKPKDPVWAFTEVNGEPVYDSSNSQDVELPQSELANIVYRVVELMGVSIKRGDLAQYMNIKEQQS